MSIMSTWTILIIHLVCCLGVFAENTKLTDGQNGFNKVNISDSLRSEAQPSPNELPVTFPIHPDHTQYSHEQLSQLYSKLQPGEILCNCTTGDSSCTVFGTFNYICRTKGGCVKAVSRKKTGGITYVMRCQPEATYVPRDRPITCQLANAVRTHMDMRCCHNEHFCAMKLNLSLHIAESSKDKIATMAVETDGPYTIIGVSLALCVVLCVIFYLLIRKLRVMTVPFEKQPFLVSEDEKQQLQHVKDLHTMLAEAAGEYTNSGSGSGLPVLVQRTIARQIELQGKHPIGSGRFGEVWLGLWKSEKVAVKIFHSFEEQSWFREVEIFQTAMLRHHNVVGFIASDNKDTGISTQLWLVTEYHANGSLFDYLNEHSVDLVTLCEMISSIAAGLAFLHSEIDGTHCKPAIAHRDLKSKNILVKNDRTCCIADLGMAVRYQEDVLELPSSTRVGTRRYLAPELLDGSFHPRQFDSYRRADIYALGLVIWEITRRTTLQGEAAFHYEMPYYDHVHSDPSTDDMKRVVCAEPPIRPTIYSAWLNHQVLSEVSRLMGECWRASPSSRLTALRVRKTSLQLTINAETLTGTQGPHNHSNIVHMA